MYFIDHLNKKIHNGAKAGDACGFIGTPSAHREFTDSHEKIEYLKRSQHYVACTHCAYEGLKVFPYNMPSSDEEK